MRAGHLSVLLALSLAASSPDVRAQSAEDRAAAETLFQTARRLLADGKISEACEKFEASNRLDPATGTMLNLSDCLERAGLTASAWISFREAATAARKAGDNRRADEASSRAAALEARLSKLTVELPRELLDLPGLLVERDGKPLLRALWGVPIPVDPGPHAIVASAPGRASFQKTLTIKPGESILFSIPPLPAPPAAASASAPASASASAPAAPAASSAPAPTAPPASPPPATGAYRAGAITAASLGALGVIVGSVYGIRASSRWDAAQSHCLQKTSQCRPEAEGLSREAVRAGNTSTLAFSLGGVLLAAGAALWWMAPTPRQSALRPDVRVGHGHASLSLEGSF